MSDKRKGTMSDEDRALAELQRRRAPSEPALVPRNEFDEDHLTPVQPVIEKVHAELCDRIVLSEREQWLTRTLLDLLVPAVWMHAANVEMRGRKRSDSQDGAQLARRINDLEDQHTRLDVDLRGDENRKERGRVGALEVFNARIVKWALGAAVALVSAAISFGIWMGSVRTDLDNLKQRAERQQLERWRSLPPGFPAPTDKDQ